MYGPPRLRKPELGMVDDSPRKCIRPLASEPRLRPGRDEISAWRSYKTLQARGLLFWCQAYATPIDCFVILPSASRTRPNYPAAA